MVKLLKGNPLSLYFAFQRLHDMHIWELLDLLRSRQKEIPDEMLNEVFLPLQIGFERMPPALRRKFMHLGAMNRFHSIDNQTLAALWEGSIVETSKLIVPELQNYISPFQAAGAGNWRLHEQTHLFAMSKFGELNLDEQDTALNWTKRLDDLVKSPASAVEKSHETSIVADTRLNHPFRIGTDQFQSFNKVVRHVVRSLFGNNNSYEEFIQKELTRISSYEYFVCKKIQQQEREYLKSIRVWILITIGLPMLILSINACPDRMIHAIQLTALVTWTIYSIKMCKFDLVGVWKNTDQCQLIQNSVKSRCLEETGD